ncbi:MAG: PD-(D/E)XK nuclease family protein [Arenicellales bacterium WSBS_2016_MAG_OTU3]
MSTKSSDKNLSHDQWLPALEAGATMLVPNRLLAAKVQKSYAIYQQSKRLRSWQTPKVNVFGVWRRGVCLRWLEQNNDFRVLMSDRQTHALWEQVVAAHLPEAIQHTQPQVFISDMARSALQAWKLSFDWMLGDDLDSVYLSKDQFEFGRWHRTFTELCKQHELVDEASVFASVVEQRADVLHTNTDSESCCWFFGFQAFSKLQKKLIQNCLANGVDIRLCSSIVSPSETTRYEFGDLTEELRAAAAFAKQKTMQSPDATVAVLLPSIDANHKLIDRLFSETFYAHQQDGTSPLKRFQLMRGESLTSEPVIIAAIDWLRFIVGGADDEAFTKLILSPFIAGAESEKLARAQWDIRFRKRGYTRLQSHELSKELASGYCPECPPQLCRIFARLQELNFTKAQKLPGDWAQDFDHALKQCLWPGERSLNEFEQQAVTAFTETLEKQLELNLLSQKTGAANALNKLIQALDSVVVRRAGSEARVQIMSLPEAIGQTFDSIWMANLDDKQWPPALTSNPFLSRKLLEQAGAPDGNQVLGHEHYSAMMRSLLASGGEVVVSSSRQHDGLDVSPSSLIEDIPGADWQSETTLHSDDETIAKTVIEEWIDVQGLPLQPSSERYSGGTGLFKNQSDCPFKAYAINRLGVVAPLQIEPALTALERGEIMHDALLRFWTSVKSQKDLLALTDEGLTAQIAASVDAAIKRFCVRQRHRLPFERAHAEQQRLCSALAEWMDQERKRTDDFYIEDLEAAVSITVGELTVAGKIDRVDATQNGSVLIDYKIGKKSRASWHGERPDEPQLPLYRYAYGEVVIDIAFANLKRDEPAYVMATKKATDSIEWNQMTEAWNSALEQLASEFMQGKAAVDPRKPDVCKYCELTSFCRRTELLGISEPQDLTEAS